MAGNPKNNIPKVPPSVINGASGKATREPGTRPRSVKRSSMRSNGQPSQRGMLSVMSLLISLFSLGLSMAGGAWIALGVLADGLSDQVGITTRIVVVGLAYTIGWFVSLFGIRILGNLILPFFIKAYALIVLVGVCALQIAIITRLFKQQYDITKFTLYLLMFGAGMVALVGLHLIIEKHNLIPFSIPILAISLMHLVLIVVHYVFLPLEAEMYGYIWGDAVFFLFTGVVSTLMLAHFGLLNGFRNGIDKFFNAQNGRFMPPN